MGNNPETIVYNEPLKKMGMCSLEKRKLGEYN